MSAPSSASRNSAIAAARLPGFLRPTGSTTRASDFYHQYFRRLEKLEHDRLQHASHSNAEFNLSFAVKDQVRDLNRYSDILPYAHSQVSVGLDPPRTAGITPAAWANAVKAGTVPSSPLADSYINANFISAPASLLSEDRRRRGPKAERYWPLAGQSDRYEYNLADSKKLVVVVKNEDRVDSQDPVTYRRLVVNHWVMESVSQGQGQDQGQPQPQQPHGPGREVLLVHYQAWPDHGVPTQTTDLRNVLHEIRTWKAMQTQQALARSEQAVFGPTVVHCSAGCGRTGTFCVIDTVLSVLEHTQFPHLAAPFTPTATLPLSSLAVSPEGVSQGSRGDGGAAGDGGNHLHSTARGVSASGKSQNPSWYDFEGDRDIVYEALESFRQDRMLMVQTAAQYSFCYNVVYDFCHH
ncbi:Tyrosine-protein phosphatase non-receptor type 6 [Lunasporangiospora selenospora]|uniref:Tyrosine-protein phosphatase non-receptor type 6 n=1 Tax=Lunasporangiospora selenospora TaxID=979761 RepID=A0A9P6KFZ6_9FUNG|nr:Tyrosine-protein phosphatase non-receptor type 6 [Lunasporangiospora selenospora]